MQLRYPRFAFAQRARCAAAILLRPAAEIVRLGLAFCLVHRAFCARLMGVRFLHKLTYTHRVPLEQFTKCHEKQAFLAQMALAKTDQPIEAKGLSACLVSETVYVLHT
jgi:hypothetical protein